MIDRLLNALAALLLVLFVGFLVLDSRYDLVPQPVQPERTTRVAPTVMARASVTPTPRPTTAPRPTYTPFVRPTQVPTETLSIPWRPLVAFNFDDTYETTYSLAYPLLERYGLRAGVAVISDLVGDNDRLGWPQIQALDRAGWDILAGTVSHPDTTRLTEVQLEQELRQNRADIEMHLGGERVTGLIWQYTNAAGPEWSIASDYFDWSASGADRLDGAFLLRHGLPEEQQWWRYRLPSGVVARSYASDGDITGVVQHIVDGPEAWLINVERVRTQGATGLELNISDLQVLVEYLLANQATIVTPNEFHRILRYGKPEYFQPGAELIRNGTFTLESQTRGVPSSFEIRSGEPRWSASGGPDEKGYAEVTQAATFQTVALPVQPGREYRFSLLHKAGTSTGTTLLVGAEFRDLNMQVLDTLELSIPAGGEWSEASVEFTAPEQADSAQLFVVPEGSGSVLTTAWSLSEQ